MADYLSLEDAAKKLGIPTDRLVDLRSQGQVRGFRDGASWKFPENEIERLADELGDLPGGSGDLISDLDLGSGLSLEGSSSIIGGDGSNNQDGGSDVELGVEPSPTSGSSDVNLIASGSGSGKDKLVELDSADLQLEHPALMHDSAQIDLSLEPNAGSTGPVTDEQLKELVDAEPKQVSAADSHVSLGSDLNLGSDLLVGGSDLVEGSDGDLSFVNISEEDSDDVVLGADDEDSDLDVLAGDAPDGSNIASRIGSSGVSSLELMDELDSPAQAGTGVENAVSGDVLSELDLLSAEKGDSGLISGDSENLLASSGIGSGLSGLSSGSALSGSDDALADDDDLLLADDDDDLVINSLDSDLSVAGDSGINLMSPSDSGLSLESEPLDLAGSSVSALDLADELGEGGSGSGLSGIGSVVDFQSDEEFQLSPSGISLESEMESGSQVIEVEESEAIAEPIDLGGDAFGDAEPMDAGFGEEDAGGFDDEASDAGAGIDISKSRKAGGAVSAGSLGYEVPFTMLQCVTLMMIILVLSLGGMLMTDLMRNMWTYSESSAPVSSLTDSLISLMGW